MEGGEVGEVVENVCASWQACGNGQLAGGSQAVAELVGARTETAADSAPPLHERGCALERSGRW